MSDNKFLSPEELANRYRGSITIRTLANWRSAGTGPPFQKIGGAVLYELKAVEAWEKESQKKV